MSVFGIKSMAINMLTDQRKVRDDVGRGPAGAHVQSR